MSQLRSPSVLIIHFIFPHQVLDMSHLRSPSILILQSSASHIRSLITSPYVSALVTSAGSHFACFAPLILPRILTHLRALLSPFTSTYRKPCSHRCSATSPWWSRRTLLRMLRASRPATYSRRRPLLAPLSPAQRGPPLAGCDALDCIIHRWQCVCNAVGAAAQVGMRATALQI